MPEAPPPARADAVLSGLVALGVLLEALLRPDVLWPLVTVPLGLAAAAALAWRRVRPLLVLVPVFTCFVALDIARLLADEPDEAPFVLAVVIVLPYAVARWGSGRAAVAGLSLVSLSAVLATVIAGGPFADAVGGFGVLAATVALGVAVRMRATARRRELERVRGAERVDLARDLHDTVAHHVSAIAIRAQAGRAAAAADPDAAVQALDVIEDEATRALEEMRDMVLVLRTEAASYAPQPGIHDLESLANAPGGLPVEVRRDPAVGALPSAVDQALFRIAQESVTNARRHAAGASVVRIQLTRIADGHRDRLCLEVTDDGDPAVERGDGGHGIVGMSERAALLGGRLTAGPRPAGGWLVRAELPVAAAAPAPHPVPDDGAAATRS